ncbi:thermonuclease family protein [Neisseria sp. Ec49-e6-T10]|uniref:thermonuclease family protein n=1 Tax=Neisseria sp. Ec49-e6-T10 TaxID=3140744 RepID=UPI003EC1036D
MDAPESGQAYGQKAKQALTDLVFGKEVLVETRGIDKYKRTLGIIIDRDFMAYQACEDRMSEQARKTNQRMTWECNLPMHNINHNLA